MISFFIVISFMCASWSRLVSSCSRLVRSTSRCQPRHSYYSSSWCLIYSATNCWPTCAAARSGGFCSTSPSCWNCLYSGYFRCLLLTWWGWVSSILLLYSCFLCSCFVCNWLYERLKELISFLFIAFLGYIT